MEFIDNKMFRAFEKLLSLDLSHNDLIEVDSGALLKSPRLTRIILADNNLRTIWRNTFIDQVSFLSIILILNLCIFIEFNSFT